MTKRYTLSGRGIVNSRTQNLLDNGKPTDAYASAAVIDNISDECEITGGEFIGGTFYGGRYKDGWFIDGEFNGGLFDGGVFHDGKYHGGEFHAGRFYDGNYHSGTFTCESSVYFNGEFYGGNYNAYAEYGRIITYYTSPYDIYSNTLPVRVCRVDNTIGVYPL